MSGYDREYLLKELCIPVEAVDKAEHHFGAKIANDTALDWIFNDFPGYDPSGSNCTTITSKALVLPHSANTDWGLDHAPTVEQQEHPPWASNALNALGQEFKPGEVARKQWEHFEVDNRGRVEDMVDNTDAELDRGRAGRPSPVEVLQTGGGREDPVDLTSSQELSRPPLVLDEDDELQKALALSMQDQVGRHAPSATRLPILGANEDEDMAQAMSLSIAELERQGSLTLDSETEDPKYRIRAHPDVPVTIQAPSAFLSHIPALLQTLYYNSSFRSTLLSIAFPYSLEPSYENYATEDPAFPTRALLPEGTEECVIKMASLQRLFLFLQKTRRASASLADFVHSFKLVTSPVGSANSRSPLEDIKELHQNICDAYVEFCSLYLRPALKEKGASEEDIVNAITIAKQVLMTQCVPINFYDRDLMQEEPVEDFDDSMVGSRTEWFGAAAMESFPPERNDTYAVLDHTLASKQSTAFILRTSQSLYFQIKRVQRPSSQNTFGGQALSLTSQNEYSAAAITGSGKPFQIAPQIYLDRYDWYKRRELAKLREEVDRSKAVQAKLEAKKDRLTLHRKTGRSIINLSDEEEGVKDMNQSQSMAGATGKPTSTALLERAVSHLRMTSESTSDLGRKEKQLVLAGKLSQIIAIMKEEVINLDTKISQIEKTSSTIWDGQVGKNLGPYNLCSVIMWKGLQGRDSTYAYVRSGTSKAEIAGETIENDRWWKVGEAKSEEVSKDAVLNDTTGVYMPGGGSLVHGYVSQSAEDDANKMYRMPSLLSDAIELDNRSFKNELPNELTAGWYEDVSAESNAGMPLAENPLTSGSDVQMQSTSNEPSSVAPSEPLDLRGGGSIRRRSSISSNTGSVASTSKLRIEDDPDDEDEDDSEEAIELGFAVKMKKAFKVAKDVGKIGGKPTWLNPALPLKTSMVICQVCNERMRFLLQMNAPKDELPQATYRTFYVYTCRRASCLKKHSLAGVKVFRAQLPAENPFYYVQRQEDQSQLQRFKDKQYAGFCPDCKMRHDPPCNGTLWKEWLIETGPEEEAGHVVQQVEGDEAIVDSATRDREDDSADANEPDTKTSVDVAFLRFQEKLRNEPDQILRYYSSDVLKRPEPLWISDEHKANSCAIPDCKCGSKRSCEFQILSTVLSYIGVDDLDRDSLDFGTIVVYSCDNSCSSPNPPDIDSPDPEFKRFIPTQGWEEEVVHVQNYSLRGVEFR